MGNLWRLELIVSHSLHDKRKRGSCQVCGHVFYCNIPAIRLIHGVSSQVFARCLFSAAVNHLGLLHF